MITFSLGHYLDEIQGTVSHPVMGIIINHLSVPGFLKLGKYKGSDLLSNCFSVSGLKWSLHGLK